MIRTELLALETYPYTAQTLPATSIQASNPGKENPRRPRPLRTERETHHDVRTRQVGPAEELPLVGRSRELAFEEVELGLQVRGQEPGLDAAGDQEGERADEEGGGGLDGWRGVFGVSMHACVRACVAVSG